MKLARQGVNITLALYR